jgi:hypothetical protein
LGELDHAEREIMQTRTVAMPQAIGGLAGILLVIFALRYGLGAFSSLFGLSSLVQSPQAVNTFPGGAPALYGGLLANALILVGLGIGVGVLFNVRNLAFRLPGFSSPVPRTRTMTWVGYAAVMVLLGVVVDGVIPGLERADIKNAPQGQYTHVSATAADDGSDSYVVAGGDLTVDLSSWPAAEWAGMSFKTSNPSVLSLDQVPSAGAPAVAKFSARQVGAARVDAASADGRYTFQVRVTVFASS